jgi:hypothetical protein
MADYYPILARAISSLAINNAEARREIFLTARELFSLKNWADKTRKNQL